MSNINISPNMNLPVPVVSEDPGPDWATNNNACLNAVDSHNHSTGQGVQINPSGLNINSDLPFSSNNATQMRSVNFTAQLSPLALPTDLGCIYVSGKDLYYNDEDGNQVRITTGGNVNAGAGSITGLPSGTASVSFGAATFTFQSATNTPATINVGPIVTGAASASPKTVTISASGSQPANYALTWPLSLPGSTSFINLDASGNMGSVAATGSGDVVLASGADIDAANISNSAIEVAAITSSTLDSTVIGGITPAAATVSQMKIGASGPTFKTLVASGSLSAHASTVIKANGTYSSLFGVIGTSTFDGSSSNVTSLGNITSSSRNCYFFVDGSGGDIKIINGDGSTNSFTATIFYN